MSALKEKALAAYQAAEEQNQAEYEARRKKELDELASVVLARVQRDFSLPDATLTGLNLVVVAEKDNYPYVTFAVDDLLFQTGGRDRDSYLVGLGPCPECQEEKWTSFYLSSPEQLLTSLGEALTQREASHRCRPKPAGPKPPPDTVKYSVNSAEQRLIEAIGELVESIVNDMSR